jgi:hypothetical protein
MIPSHYSSIQQKPAESTTYHEPYGEVRTTGLGTSSVAQRRHGDANAAAAAATNYPTYFIPTAPVGLRSPRIADVSYSPSTTTTSNTTTASPFQTKLKYQHNATALVFLLPPLLGLMWLHASSYPMQAFLLMGLCLYGLDLANLRQGAAVCVWIGFGLLLCVSGWFILLDEGDDEDSGGYVLGLLLRIAINSFLYFCLVGIYGRKRCICATNALTYLLCLCFVQKM